MIAVIHTGLGNFQSVVNAVRAVGNDVVLTHDAEEIRGASHLILPGVGAYAAGMSELKKRDLITLLQDEVMVKKKPILGICLGMQLLTGRGTEGGETAGLGWIAGVTERLRNDSGNLRLPHVGWNEVAPLKHSRLFSGIETGTAFYFIHSYCVKPHDAGVTSAIAEYGQTFTCALERENIAGIQFHPEKSHSAGLKVIQNFVERFA
jgi:glutamine amidotransferase